MKEQRGLTLIELVVYLGIVTVVLLVIMNFGWEIQKGSVKSYSRLEVSQNIRFTAEKISREIEKAKAVTLPQPGSLSDFLVLEMADPASNPTVIELSGSKIIITQGESGPFEMTTDRVGVTNLQFQNLSLGDAPGIVRFELEIEHLNPTGLAEYAARGKTVSASSLLPSGQEPQIAYCQGSSSSCSNFSNQHSCGNQEGCFWAAASCGGSCTSCQDLDFGDCFSQDGCSWSWFSWECIGTCASCQTISRRRDCLDQQGCSWQSSFCSGTPLPCESYINQSSCLSQEGCLWSEP